MEKVPGPGTGKPPDPAARSHKFVIWEAFKNVLFMVINLRLLDCEGSVSAYSGFWMPLSEKLLRILEIFMWVNIYY